MLGPMGQAYCGGIVVCFVRGSRSCALDRDRTAESTHHAIAVCLCPFLCPKAWDADFTLVRIKPDNWNHSISPPKPQTILALKVKIGQDASLMCIRVGWVNWETKMWKIHWLQLIFLSEACIRKKCSRFVCLCGAIWFQCMPKINVVSIEFAQKTFHKSARPVCWSRCFLFAIED